MSSPPRRKPDYGIDAPGLLRGCLLVGIALIVGGEALCFSCLKWSPRLCNGICHVMVYGGILLVFKGAVMFWSSKAGKLRLRDRMLGSIVWRGDESVLDVGCGHGLLLIGAAKRLTAGRATGVDIWSQVDQAKNSADATLENARREGVSDRVAVKNSDARQLPFQDDAFDVVLSSFTLHNISGAGEREKAVREIARVLRPGGRLAIADILFTGQYEQTLRKLGWTQVEHGLPNFFLFLMPTRVLRAAKPS